MNLVFAPLRKSMDKSAFTCGEPALDGYLQHQARQDMERGFSTVFIAAEASTPEVIIGFYTLSAASIPLGDIPESLRKKMPRYQAIPAVLQGRLAVSTAVQGRHIGTLLVVDALSRACRNELAWAVFCVDAKNTKITTFYEKLMFRPFQERPGSLWMSRAQADMIIHACA